MMKMEEICGFQAQKGLGPEGTKYPGPLTSILCFFITGLIPSGTGHIGPSEVLTGSTSGGICVVPSVTYKFVMYLFVIYIKKCIFICTCDVLVV
jgi:hypothetical protein